jgi:hypothetical protein
MSGIVDKKRQLESSLSAADKVKIAEANHIWINAFATVRPNPQDLMALGQMVLDKVLESEVADDLSGSFPVTWIRVNAS